MATTWNPSDKSAGMTLSNGNLTATGGIGGNGVRAVHCLRSGKYYWEYTATTWTGSSACGLNTGSATVTTPSAVTVISLNANGSLNVNNGISIAFGVRANGDVVCFAVDFDNQLVWVRVGAAGNWNNSASFNPATGVGGVSYLATPISVQTLYPWAYSSGSGNAFTANFGDSAFTGAVPAGFTSGVPAVTPPLIAADTQIALEQWAMPNAQAQLTQVAQELWRSVAGTAAKSGVYTYVVAGGRSGLSGVVAETQTKTYAVAMPAVLTESYVAPPVVTGPSTQGARVMIMA